MGVLNGGGGGIGDAEDTFPGALPGGTAWLSGVAGRTLSAMGEDIGLAAIQKKLQTATSRLPSLWRYFPP